MSQRADYLEQCISVALQRALDEFTQSGHKGMAESMRRALREVAELAQLSRQQKENENDAA